LREHIRDGRFRWGAAIVTVILAGSIGAGARDYTSTRRAQEEAQRAEYEGWLNKGQMGAHWAAHYGMQVFKVPMPFSSLDAGVSDFSGTHVLLEVERQGLFQDAPSTYEHSERRLGQVTAGAALETLVPLLIVLMLFGAVAGERESGTLRQLASLGLSPRTIAAGKILGAVTPISFVLVSAFLGGAALIAGASSTSHDLWLRLIAAAVAYALYVWWFVLGTLTISMLARTARQALVASLLMWFFVCLLLPRVMMQAGAAAYPEPTPHQFADALNEERRHPDPSRVASAHVDAALRYYKVASAAALPVNALSHVGYLASQIVDDDTLSRHVGRLFAAYRQQDRVYQAGAWLSPTIAVQALSIALSETDVASHEHFWDAARRYGFQMQWVLHEDATTFGDRQDRGRDLWARVPPFTYPSMAIWQAISGARDALLGFSGSLMLIGLIATTCVRRVRV
jgi:ABC-2 type transport system permease protein